MKIIDDILINEIERDFLPAGSVFDTERRNFISTLTSCDLLAVPGSGKTTALQAKLACLTRCIEYGDGILVLSHTNTAVDEIKKNLNGQYACLFGYPNYVCTIQDFVDTFLALPYYENKYGYGVEAIDKDRYEDEMAFFLKGCLDRRVRYVSQRMNFNQVRFGLKNNALIIGEGVNCNPISYKIPGTWNGHEEENKEFVYNWLKRKKLKILSNGILHYDDCYFLAEFYICKYPEVIEVLRKRFNYVFIDETQDLQHHQLDLIDRIFNCQECVLQRIGDINQSIYNQVADCTVWVPRNEMFLNNSLRLTDEVASVINAFTLEKGDNGLGNPRFVVNGQRHLVHPIPPYLVLFDEASINLLEKEFWSIIESYSLQMTVEGKKYGFHIVGWNAKATDEPFNINELRLEEIFPQYVKKAASVRKSFQTLSEYIQCGRKENSIEECRKSLLQILCKITRLAEKKDSNGRYFTPSSLLKVIADNQLNGEKMDRFLYVVSSRMVQLMFSEAYYMIKDFVSNSFSQFMSFSIDEPISVFFEPEFKEIISANQSETYDYPIKIGTIHSVKGMTHCATMYVETFFYQYECNHLIKKNRNSCEYKPSPYFKDNVVVTKSREKQAMKMLYVGMSRPTHLLCYASLKQNWDEAKLQKMIDGGWQVVDMTI